MVVLVSLTVVCLTGVDGSVDLGFVGPSVVVVGVGLSVALDVVGRSVAVVVVDFSVV